MTTTTSPDVHLDHATEPLRFAYWVPNVSGGLVVSTLPQRTSHDPAYNVDTAKIAEQVGFDYALTQVRYSASYGADAQHESTSFSLALLLATERLKVIAAVHPYFWNPAVLAKFAATSAELTRDRLALNVVSGWFKNEAISLGAPWFEHDERYRQSEEFIRVLRQAWTQDGSSHRGDFFRTSDLTFRPQPRVQPEVFQGGNSASAQAMAGRVSDWYFMNGKSLDAAAEQVRQVRAVVPSPGSPDRIAPSPIRFGLNGFAVVRDTEAEAVETVEAIIANADADKVRDFGEAVKQAGGSTADRKGMWADSEFKDLVQYNDGFRTGLVGTPEQVARRILAYRVVGIDLMLLGFLHVREDVEAFGRTVIPLVRELEARRSAGEDLGLGEELDAAVAAAVREPAPVA